MHSCAHVREMGQASQANTLPGIVSRNTLARPGLLSRKETGIGNLDVVGLQQGLLHGNRLDVLKSPSWFSCNTLSVHGWTHRTLHCVIRNADRTLSYTQRQPLTLPAMFLRVGSARAIHIYIYICIYIYKHTLVYIYILHTYIYRLYIIYTLMQPLVFPRRLFIFWTSLQLMKQTTGYLPSPSLLSRRGPQAFYQPFPQQKTRGETLNPFRPQKVVSPLLWDF